MQSQTIVLVVDDGDETWSTVRRICREAGLVAQHVLDAENATKLVERGHPSIVITSRTLPDRDGLVFIAQVRLALPDVLIAVVCDTRDLSVMDAGADIVLTRPLDEQVIASMLQAAVAQRASDAAPPTLSLLVVEPDPHLAVVMKRWLGARYKVTLVTSGWRAIQEIESLRPDAVLTELRLPDMDPSEFHDRAERAMPGLGERTLFMTAGFVPDRAQQFLAKIPGQWIYKPFDLPKLRAALEALFN